MSFRWRSYLDLAKKIRDTGSTEEHWRTCVSRAYYAAFGEVFERLGPFLPNDREFGVHDRLWVFLKRRNGLVPKKIGIAGDRLKQLRVVADYKADRILTDRDAERALSQCVEIIQQLDATTVASLRR